MSTRPTVSLTRTTARRRAALRALETNIDDGIWAERGQAVRALLARPLHVGSSPVITLIIPDGSYRSMPMPVDW